MVIPMLHSTVVTIPMRLDHGYVMHIPVEAELQEQQRNGGRGPGMCKAEIRAAVDMREEPTRIDAFHGRQADTNYCDHQHHLHVDHHRRHTW